MYSCDEAHCTRDCARASMDGRGGCIAFMSESPDVFVMSVEVSTSGRKNASFVAFAGFEMSDRVDRGA